MPQIKAALRTLRAGMAPRAVCVSIHDVAPATWAVCKHLLDAIDAVAPIPVTLLVVPDYHRCGSLSADQAFLGEIEKRRMRGDEIVLHGYYHLDDGPPARGIRERLRRGVYTAGEGEFATLDANEARERIERGLKLMRGLGWPISGFVPPAWLLSAGSWAALEELPFTYTSTMRGLYRLPARTFIPSQSLVYSVRSAFRRWAFRRWNAELMKNLQDNSLLRMGLHPVDASHPQVVRDWQGFLAEALRDREAMTKVAFIQNTA